MKQKILFLTKQGCDFDKYTAPELLKSDLQNHRYFIRNTLRLKTGDIAHCTEIMNGYAYDDMHKPTRQNAMYMEFECTNQESGIKYGLDVYKALSKLSGENTSHQYYTKAELIIRNGTEYNKENVLKYVNKLSTEEYTKIIIFDTFKFYKIAGYREKTIFENFSHAEEYEAPKGYEVIEIFDNDGNSFLWDIKNNQVRG